MVKKILTTKGFENLIATVEKRRESVLVLPEIGIRDEKPYVHKEQIKGH
jgi:hypothetical protein